MTQTLLTFSNAVKRRRINIKFQHFWMPGCCKQTGGRVMGRGSQSEKEKNNSSTFLGPNYLHSLPMWKDWLNVCSVATSCQTTEKCNEVKREAASHNGVTWSFSTGRTAGK